PVFPASSLGGISFSFQPAGVLAMAFVLQPRSNGFANGSFLQSSSVVLFIHAFCHKFVPHGENLTEKWSDPHDVDWLGCWADPLAGVLLLQLHGAAISKRRMQPSRVVDPVDE